MIEFYSLQVAKYVLTIDNCEQTVELHRNRIMGMLSKYTRNIITR